MQLLLDQRRYEKVVREAKHRRTSAAAVIRTAIDLLPDEQQDRGHAVDAIFAAVPMEVPEQPAAIRRELDEGYTFPL